MEDIGALRGGIRARLASGDVAGAWALLPERAALPGASVEVALTWLETARIAPAHASSELLEAVEALDAAHLSNPEVSISAALTLVSVLSRRPVDAPATEDRLADAALAIAERVAGSSIPDALRPFAQIQLANALRLHGRARDDEASAAFDAAIAARPEDPGFRFDRGLFDKSRGRFTEAYEAFATARELGQRDRALVFNLAVCATALGRGEDARRAWSSLGIEVEVNDAGMPFAPGLSAVELRVPTRGTGHASTGPVPDAALSFEVVSVAALSPCHGVVQTPTLRDAPVDYGDVVLWDGVPVGRQEVDGRTIPRFALLEILRRGDERRFLFIALEKAAGETARLGARLPDGAELFVLEARVEAVCPRCAAGEALTKHTHHPPEEHRITRGKLVVRADVALDAVRDALETAIREGGEVTLAVPALYDALDDAKRAGREHQAYRGIERVGLKKGLSGAR